jgi:hypothetical protein
MIVNRFAVLCTLVIALLSVSSCQRYKGQKEVVNANGYFSITQFANDAINTYGGTPFSLYRIAYINDAVDSTVVNLLNMDWASIFITFNATDISYNKYKDLYKEELIDDPTTSTRAIIYTAQDPKLLTRLMNIAVDPLNNKITSIYIETAKHDFWGDKTQKLLYVPLRVLQIQEAQSHLIGKSKKLRVEYRFMNSEEPEVNIIEEI